MELENIRKKTGPVFQKYFYNPGNTIEKQFRNPKKIVVKDMA